MSDEISLPDLLERLRCGDNDAATEIVNRFGDRLVNVARGRLDRLLLRKVDPEDVVQSVCRSAIIRLGDGRLTATDWNALWRLLVCITVNKCLSQAEYFHAARRSVYREVDLEGEDDSAVGFQHSGNEPAPDEAALLVEAVEQLLSSFRDEKHRQIVQLRLQHWSPPEIALELDISERTVSRVLDRVRILLERRLAVV